jgi:hypothetical protein
MIEPPDKYVRQTAPASPTEPPEASDVTEWPARRRLKIFAFDPLYRGLAGNRITIDIPNEMITSGPTSDRLKVIDYDGSLNVYYKPVDLNEPPILMRDGLDPSESNPRFHQQMVYAVTMRVLENWERALGRRINFSRSRPLRILPHAFRGQNAFFEPASNSVLFGYFEADAANPGENLPGQTVFSCLSHDIIAHEVTHAIVYRLKRHFNEPTNEDVLAFHEAVADIVAIFQHFTVPDVLRSEIQRQHGDLSTPGVLLDLAKQFGHGTGHASALRSALGDAKPSPDDYATIREPHERGSLLVSAVFDAFFHGYQNRIRDVVKVATGGTGVLPVGDLPSDLLQILATEASNVAQIVLSMSMRAFEYLPPLDIRFGDYLRALVTSDRELFPEDRFGIRDALIEAFRVRGIFPETVYSLAEESLVWPEPRWRPDQLDAHGRPPRIDRDAIGQLMTAYFFNDALEEEGLRQIKGGSGSHAAPPAPSPSESPTEVPAAARADTTTPYGAVYRFAMAHREALALDPALEVEIHGLHPTFRVASNGRVRLDIVIQLVQERPTTKKQRAELGGMRLLMGSTVILNQQGEVRFVIAKPLVDSDAPRQRTVKRLQDHIRRLDDADDDAIWRDPSYFDRRMLERANFAIVDAARSKAALEAADDEDVDLVDEGEG